VTGGGEITVNTTGGVASFGFNAKQTASCEPVSGHFNYVDHVTGLHINGPVNISLAAAGTNLTDPVTFKGTVTTFQAGTSGITCTNGCTFTVKVQDFAEPGAGVDRFGIEVFDGSMSVYSKPAPATTQTIFHGNIQRHF
jgi:hypothetical protein